MKIIIKSRQIHGKSLIIMLVLSLVCPSHIYGNTLFAEDFKTFSLDQWAVQRNMQWNSPLLPCMNGVQIANWRIDDGKIGIKINSLPCVTEIAPKEFSFNHDKNYSVSFDWIINEGIQMDRNFAFKWKDAKNWYGLKLYGESLIVQKVIDGKSIYLNGSQTNYPFKSGNTYNFNISVIDFQIHVRIDDSEVLVIDDSSPQIEGELSFALQASVGNNPYSTTTFDNILVTDLSTASFPHFFQTDPAWANKEYDSAANWSPEDPSIARWGCALSSLAMILRSHGINYLSDGTEIDPASLNTWLLSQPDGYLQHGLVNFAAAMRLSRELHDSYGTPKLEYVRENSPDLTTAIQQVTDKKPVVLQIPGHFLVGYDTTDQFDLKIKDPAYPYSQFSEHETHLVSTRTFTPSNTDLSFLVLTHPPELDISLKLPDGSIVTSQEDFIHSTETTSTSPPLAVSEFAKPATGTYTVSISSEDLSVHDFSLYTYDQLGNPTIHTQTVSSGPASTTYELTYHKDGRSTLSPVLEVSTILENLGTLREKGHIRKQYAYLLFSHLFSQLDSLPAQELPKHTSYLRFLVEWFSLGISDEGNAFLLNQISEIERSLDY